MGEGPVGQGTICCLRWQLDPGVGKERARAFLYASSETTSSAGVSCVASGGAFYGFSNCLINIFCFRFWKTVPEL